MKENVHTIDYGTALGGRLAWAHIGTEERSNVFFAIDGELARSATPEPTPDTRVIGVDYDLVYVAYGREIVRFQLVSDGTVVAIDPIPSALARILGEADQPH